MHHFVKGFYKLDLQVRANHVTDTTFLLQEIAAARAAEAAAAAADAPAAAAGEAAVPWTDSNFQVEKIEMHSKAILHFHSQLFRASVSCITALPPAGQIFSELVAEVVFFVVVLPTILPFMEHCKPRLGRETP